MKQYNRYIMEPDGKWTRASLLCMAGALFSFAVYYLGLRGLASVGLLEGVFCLFLPLIVMAGYIAIMHFLKWNAPGLFALMGLVLCATLIFGNLDSGILRIILSVIWYSLCAIILVCCAGGYLPKKEPAIFAFPIAIFFRLIIFGFGVGVVGYVYEIAASLIMASLGCLMMSFEGKKYR